MRAQQVATESAAAQERGPPMQRWGGRLGGTPRPTMGGSRCCATAAKMAAPHPGGSQLVATESTVAQECDPRVAGFPS